MTPLPIDPLPKLSRRQLVLLNLLVSRPGATTAEIASAIGRSEKTVQRMLADPAFREAFRTYVDGRFAVELGQFKTLLNKALLVLDRALDLSTKKVSWPARVRAARVVVAGVRDLTLDDILRRLELLEEAGSPPAAPAPADEDEGH